MCRSVVLVATVLAFLILNGQRTLGQESSVSPTVKTLKGIGGVRVLIEELSADAKALGLDQDTMRTDVELKLRLAGLRVLSENEWLDTLGTPALHVTVTVPQLRGAAAIHIEMYQGVRLVRDGQEVLASTWFTSGVMSNPTAELIRSHVKDQVDAFINDWLSANPRRSSQN